MSRSFGPIDRRADFFDALARTLAYARSDAFWSPFLRGGVERELQAILAWTAGGRTPRLGERCAANLSWALARELEGAEGEGPPEWVELIELTGMVSWWFACWPEDDEAARTLAWTGAAWAPRKPTPEELAGVRDLLAEALAVTPGVPADRPPEAAFQSTRPLFADTMSTPTWARFVLLPRLEAMVEGGTTPPARSQLCALAKPLAGDRATWPLLYALGALDDLFVRALPNHHP